ncbi:MAG: N-acetyltransferase [Salaquimonas sp.]|jgi:hypothetical protein|nr:N-acetyltransferase [Salaquimonas sp.]
MSDGIRLEENETKGRYVYAAEGGPEAFLTFSKAGATRIIVDHTEVPDFYRGKGVGLKLVERVVADAREQGKAIVPLCPYAAAQFRRHPEWADLLDPHMRAKGQAR